MRRESTNRSTSAWSPRDVARQGVSPARAALILAWTPFMVVMAHVVVYAILPLQMLAITLAIGLAGEAVQFHLRRRSAARPDAARA